MCDAVRQGCFGSDLGRSYLSEIRDQWLDEVVPDCRKLHIVMRLKEKHWQEGRCQHIYHPAAPPLDRLLRTRLVPPPQQVALIARRQSINPVAVRTQIHNLLDQIFALPAADGAPQDVRLTLFSQEVAIAR